MMGNNTGLKINSLFALPANRLRLCGSATALSAMENCALGNGCEGVAEEIPTFRTLWPYLQLIGDVAQIDPFSQRAAESYWLGDPVIYRFKPQHFELLLQYFSEHREISGGYVEQLRGAPPKAFIPFHTFQVLLSAKHGGGINESTLPGINQCMISWGKVQGVDDENQEALIRLRQLRFSSDKLFLENVVKRQFFNPDITPNLRPGNIVVCHWDTVIMPISVIRANRLEKATNDVLRIQSKI